jgi:hypothetical protein
MIELTNLSDLITSLIGKNLGKPQIAFMIYPKLKGNVLFECSSKDFKFIISKRENGLRVYDNGNVYIIPNIFPENFPEAVNSIIKTEAESLYKYYKLNYYNDKISKDIEANVYRLVKQNVE